MARLPWLRFGHTPKGLATCGVPGEKWGAFASGFSSGVGKGGSGCQSHPAVRIKALGEQLEVASEREGRLR